MTNPTGMPATRILRFEVPVDDGWHLIRVPKSNVLHVACHMERLVDFWMRESSGGTEVRAYRVFGTGQPIPQITWFEGTAVAPNGQLAWHLMSATATTGEADAG